MTQCCKNSSLRNDQQHYDQRCRDDRSNKAESAGAWIFQKQTRRHGHTRTSTKEFSEVLCIRLTTDHTLSASGRKNWPCALRETDLPCALRETDLQQSPSWLIERRHLLCLYRNESSMVLRSRRRFWFRQHSFCRERQWPTNPQRDAYVTEILCVIC